MARAIAGRPRLLMIDEALDAVQDMEERALLTDILFDARAPWTLVLVTTRPELLRRCTRVMQVNHNGLQEAA
jgi:predicted ABC-type transport system involved in lysophospholipase L1 biosynthesis ATPase subunit